MVYQSFLIADFKTGLFEAKEPWLSPQDAFSEVNNAYVSKEGIITKRKGYTEYAQMNHYQKAITGVTKANPGVVTSAGHGLSNGTSILIYDVVGMTQLNGNTYTVANAATDTFELSGVDTSAYTTYVSGGKIATFKTNAITGIKEYRTSTGTIQMLVFDTKRVAKYNTANAVLEDVVETDTFTGDEEDLFWSCNWGNKMYFTNYVDRLKTWDGSSVATPTIDIDGDTNNELTTCLIVIPFKERLVLFRTIEDGTVCPNRARWCAAGDPTNWDDTITNGGGYADAPTSDWIISAEYCKDSVLVYFQNSTWLFRYTADVDNPFRWEKIDSSRKTESTHSLVSFQDQVWIYGSQGFVGSDGFRVFSIDTNVPDITSKVNLDKTGILYAYLFKEYDQVWVLYPDGNGSSSTKNKVMVWNYRNGSWSIFDIAMNVMGSYSLQSDVTWDSETRTWDEIEESWDDFGRTSGFPIVLGGDYAGKVWRLMDSGKDDTSNIAFSMTSARWNPFVQQGYRCKFGTIGFLVTRDENIELTVDFYNDFDADAYQSLTLDFSDDLGNTSVDKTWKYLDSGEIGSTHRIKLSHTAGNQTPQIHAIKLLMEPAGELN